MIIKLPPEVVSKIAAGEVINKPYNALKELIENSLDANSSSLTVSYSDNQFTVLDDGHGIKKEDFELLCERFATSKLQSYQQLLNGQVQTFGFRGEALSSLSFVATLVVTSRVDGQNTYTGIFEQGKLQSIKRSADTFDHGTLLAVKDIFKNIPIRYKTLDKQEYQRMVDVVWKYSIHNQNVEFSIKKNGINEKLAVPQDLIAFQREGQGVVVQGKAKIADKSQLVLFINDRLVESLRIKASVGKCWCYLSLKIDPARVDVNVHPAKKQVQFLNETEIYQFIGDVVQFELAQTQQLPVHRLSESQVVSSQAPVTQKRRVSDMVRTDSRQRTLDSFVPVHQPRLSLNVPPVIKPSSIVNSQTVSSPVIHATKPIQVASITQQSSKTPVPVQNKQKIISSPAIQKPSIPLIKRVRSISDKENIIELQDQQAIKVEVELESIKQLRAELPEVSQVLVNHSFIGVISSTKALVQYDTGMYMVDIQQVCKDFFYQIALRDFQNFGKLNVQLDCLELLEIALEVTQLELQADQLLQPVLEMKDMLMDYFAIEIVDGKLTSLPLLIKDYVPELFKLPLFLLRLCTRVDFTSEKQCLKDICTLTAELFSPSNCISDHTLQHVLFHNFKIQKIATAGCQLIVTLPDLYKVFERC